MVSRTLLIASFLVPVTQIAYGATDPGRASCALTLLILRVEFTPNSPVMPRKRGYEQDTNKPRTFHRRV